MAGAVAILMILTWPEYQALQDSMAEAQVKETDLQNMVNYHQAMEGMAERLREDYDEEIKKIGDGIPDDHYVPSLFAEIRRMSYGSGVRVEGIGNFSLSRGGGEGLREVNISFNVEGSYSNFKSFVNRINNSARIKEIQEINIQRRPTTAGIEFLNYNLTLTAYFQ